MNVYVASSWRNQLQPTVVAALRREDHEVYDFRDDGFAWSDISPEWEAWPPAVFRLALEHPIARRGFGKDMDALEACEACVLVLPCGRSAHLELGWAVGAGKFTVVLLQEGEPELMYRMVDRLCLTVQEVLKNLRVAAADASR